MKASRKADFRRLLVLIHSLMLFHQFLKHLKHFHSLRLHLSSIDQFAGSFEPVQHIMFLNTMPRWIPLICFDEFHHFIVLNNPLFILRHTYYLQASLNCFPYSLTNTTLFVVVISNGSLGWKNLCPASIFSKNDVFSNLE